MELTKIYIDKIKAYPVRKKPTILINMVSQCVYFKIRLERKNIMVPATTSK